MVFYRKYFKIGQLFPEVLTEKRWIWNPAIDFEKLKQFLSEENCGWSRNPMTGRRTKNAETKTAVPIVTVVFMVC